MFSYLLIRQQHLLDIVKDGGLLGIQTDQRKIWPIKTLTTQT